jgi:hypothetical protein
MNSFYLKSIEHRSYHVKHKCIVREVVDGNKLLVDLGPAIPGWVYGKPTDLDRVVLAPRYTMMTLTPQISEWPSVVNICVPKNGIDWTSGPWNLLDIGELTET